MRSGWEFGNTASDYLWRVSLPPRPGPVASLNVDQLIRKLVPAYAVAEASHRAHRLVPTSCMRSGVHSDCRG